MRKCGAFVCLLILAMDVTAGVLSIQAQINKNKVVKMSHHETRPKSVEYCDEESSRMISETIFRLVLAATLLLAIAHILANLLGGCLCLCSTELDLQSTSSSSNIQLCFACLISSWIIAAVGFTVMIIGMLQNSSRSHGSCRMIRNHFLLIGGIFCFLHSLFCTAFYVTATISFGSQRTNGPHDHHQPRP